MNAVAWLSREETVALGWTLLHFCWQGTAVAMLYAVADRLTARATSSVRYAVALAALLLTPAIVIGTFAEELRVATSTHATHVTSDAILYLPATHSGMQPTPILHELPLASSLVDQNDWLAARTNWLTLRTDRLLPWLDALWLAGVLLLAVRALGGWWQLGLVRRRAQRMVPQEVQHAFERLCQQIHAGRNIMLRASDEVISPLAMGVWHATVILPISAVLTLPAEELEAVIAHELGHIRRWDYLWNLLQTAIESVLFFHPAVWWLGRTVRERREICCDEIAVRSCAGPAIYARALLRLEEQRTAKLQLAMAFEGCGGSLLSRVRKVLGEDMATESRMTSGVSVAAIGALMIALLLGPKIGEAVAAPLATKAQPVVAHVMAALPASIASCINKPSAQIAISAPAPVAEPHVAPVVKPDGDPVIVTLAPSQVRAATFVTADIAIAAAVNGIEFQQSSGTGSSQGTGTGVGKGSGAAYLDGMRDAGYPLDLSNDLNSLVAMKSLNVTPEYAKAMGATGLGKPTVHDLIAMKSMGVTPEYIASMKQGGLTPKDFHEVVTEKSMGITPEYAAEMKQKGFGDLNVHELVTMKSLGVTPEYAADMRKGFGDLNLHDLITMKSLGVTPEYAAEMKQKGFANLNVHDLVSMKSLGVTPEYAAEMKQKGFGDLNPHELISLKAQGMTPEYAGWLKQQFPQATMDELRRAAIFHLDDKFLADAKTHGFDGKDLDKLLKLKMSGLLDN